MSVNKISYLFIWVSLCGCLLISCVPDNFHVDGFTIQIGVPESPQPPQEAGITVKVVYPDCFLPEIAGAQAQGVLSVIDCRTGKEYARMLFQPHATTRSARVPLPSGEYAFLAWVDYRTASGCSYYDVADLRQVTMVQRQSEGVKEAYAACAILNVDENRMQEVSLPLYMPVSCYRFELEADPKEYVGKTVLVQQVGYYPVVYNVLNGECTSAVLNPTWIDKIRETSDGNVLLFEGAQFVQADRPAHSTFNLFLGNEQGNLLYEIDGVTLTLPQGGHVEKVMDEDDFWQYTEGNIIDDDFSGDIDIEI